MNCVDDELRSRVWLKLVAMGGSAGGRLTVSPQLAMVLLCEFAISKAIGPDGTPARLIEELVIVALGKETVDLVVEQVS